MMNVFQVNNKDARMTSIDVILVSLLLNLNTMEKLIYSNVNFDDVIAS